MQEGSERKRGDVVGGEGGWSLTLSEPVSEPRGEMNWKFYGKFLPHI
jgi:hypothetical protein